MKKNSLIFLCVCMLLAAWAGVAHAADPQVKIAFLSIENKGMDPRYDYLEGIINGLLLFDLGTTEGITIVDRSSLESVLKEQELILSDLTNQDQAVKVGKILGADYLLKGQYVFLGTEVMLNISLIDVSSAKTLPFSERGSTENLIHALCEQIIMRLTGRQVSLQSEQHERSIISLKDEKPGGIALLCNLIRAEIFLDNEFMGYTTGDSTVPFEMEKVPPGNHTIRVRLDGFGVVKQPEITFHDWQQTVDVKPGKRHVVRAEIAFFNTSIYDLMNILVEYQKIEPNEFGHPPAKHHSISFLDREGRKVEIALDLGTTIAGAEARVKAAVTYNGKTQKLDLACASGKREEKTERIGKVDVILRLEYEQDKRCYLAYRVRRNDIEENMWRGQ
jgi:TolB-like protein